MPESASIPAQPCSTVAATSASQDSPACTRNVTSSPGSRSIPRVTTWMTVPGTPASATTRFEPPPSANQSSPVTQTARAASMSCCRVSGATNSAAAPPIRRVVSSRRSIGQATLTRTCALPRTVAPSKVTVRSIRTVSTSSAPTFATTARRAPSAASTGTGRVKRTW